MISSKEVEGEDLMLDIIEEAAFRDRSYVFSDRVAAGRLLARKLADLTLGKAVVFAIPAGGVPVAAQVAGALRLPLDLVIVRKIQIPWSSEAGFGALAPDGKVILNEPLVQRLGLSKNEITSQIAKTRTTLEQREALFRSNRPYGDLQGLEAIVVDDGLASGFTMLAALRFLKKCGSDKIIVAVPTGLLDTIQLIRREVEMMVCLNVRQRRPFAVAAAYRNWYDVTDSEVLTILQKFQSLSSKAKDGDSAPPG